MEFQKVEIRTFTEKEAPRVEIVSQRVEGMRQVTSYAFETEEERAVFLRLLANAANSAQGNVAVHGEVETISSGIVQDLKDDLRDVAQAFEELQRGIDTQSQEMQEAIDEVCRRAQELSETDLDGDAVLETLYTALRDIDFDDLLKESLQLGEVLESAEDVRSAARNATADHRADLHDLRERISELHRRLQEA